jgi:hypothetical protein
MFGSNGWLGYVILHNKTPYLLTMSDESSTQMDKWNFPYTLTPNSSTKVPIQFEDSFWHSPDDDKGVVYYDFGQFQFKIEAFVTDECFLNISIENEANELSISPQGSIVFKPLSETDITIFTRKS